MKLRIHNAGGSIHAVFSFYFAPCGCFGSICLQSESYGFCLLFGLVDELYASIHVFLYS